MKHRIISTLFLLVLGFTVGCVNQELHGRCASDFGEPTSMLFHVEAPLSSYAPDFEQELARVRLVIFGSPTSPDAGKLLLNRYYPTIPTNKTIQEIVTSGLRDIYLIVNEPLSPDGLTPLASFAGLRSAQDIRALELAYSGGALSQATGAPHRPTTIPMFTSYIGRELLVGNENLLGGQVCRTIAKMTLNIQYTYADLPAGRILFDSVVILGLPRWSSLIAQPYINATSERLIRSEWQSLSNTSATPATTFSSSNTFYLPEFILSGKDTAPQMVVYAHLQGDAARVFKYVNPLGDGMNPTQSGSTTYNITRNRHYTYNGRVVDYGDLGLEVKVDVQPWGLVSITDNNGVRTQITKNITPFTPCDGRGEFTVALDQPSQWRADIDNREDFMIVGTSRSGAVGDRGAVFNVLPRRFVQGTSLSTVVSIVVNGAEVDRATVSTAAHSRFEWATHVVDVGGGERLLIMDRDMGASAPKGRGCFFQEGSPYGAHATLPWVGIPISAQNPALLWRVTDWDTGSAHTSTTSSWTSILTSTTPEAKRSPCPPSWRLMTRNEALTVMNKSVRYAADATSGFYLPTTNLATTLADKVYFPLHGERNSGDGSLVSTNANGVGTHSDWWIGTPGQNLCSYQFPSGIIQTGAATWGEFIRCVATVAFDYTLTYPNHNDPVVTVQRLRKVIETPLTQTTPLVHYINVIDNINTSWTISGHQGHESWLTLDKTSGTGDTRVKVTIQPNSLTPMIGAFHPARQIILKLTNGAKTHDIIVHQGGYLNVGGVNVLDRLLQNGQPLPDLERPYPAAIPIGFPVGFQACCGFHSSTKKIYEQMPISLANNAGYFRWNTPHSVVSIAGGSTAEHFWSKANDPCPTGWRVPTVDDANKYVTALPTQQRLTFDNGFNGTSLTATSGEKIYNENAGYGSGGYEVINTNVYFFTYLSDGGDKEPWIWMDTNSGPIRRDYAYGRYQGSVRCMEDK